MTTIFIKSYPKDFNLLYYALLSIDKYVSGDFDVVLLLDKGNKLPDKIKLKDYVKLIEVEKQGHGYLFQQYCKITAHKYTESDFILFSDSDCIFDHEISINDFIASGTPEILYTDYEKVGSAICWKKPTEIFIKKPVQYEFMRRNCLIYHRSTLVNISNAYPQLKNIILHSESFSEFNAIGAYAWFHEREKYNFINTDNWEYVPPKATQLWSYADKNIQGTHRDEFNRSIQTINKALGLQISEL